MITSQTEFGMKIPEYNFAEFNERSIRREPRVLFVPGFAGCWIQQKFSMHKPQLCSGDVCNYNHKELTT
jgi:hypothetical protein